MEFLSQHTYLATFSDAQNPFALALVFGVDDLDHGFGHHLPDPVGIFVRLLGRRREGDGRCALGHSPCLTDAYVWEPLGQLVDDFLGQRRRSRVELCNIGQIVARGKRIVDKSDQKRYNNTMSVFQYNASVYT